MLSAVIQAGGESRRMGKDKALLPFLNQTLIERVIQRVLPLADEVLVTTNHPQDYQFLGLPLISDILPGRGALGGLYTALCAASQPLVAVLACDMPFLNASLIAYQRDLMLNPQFDVSIPRTDEGMEPFHAIYRRRTCLEPVKNALDNDQWRVDAWYNQVQLRILPTEEIQRYDPQLLSFLNINTPEDLQAAAKLAARMEHQR